MKSNPESKSIHRRSLVAGSAAVAATLLTNGVRADEDTPKKEATPNAKTGRLQQAVCKWCFPKVTLEELADMAVSLGLVGIDLLTPDQFEVVQSRGLVCTMVQSHPLAKGLCDPKHHEMAIEKTAAAIEAAGNAGFKNVICFSGNARGIDRETGMNHCVKALKELTPLAEKANVTLQMELLNSKVNHPDYMCDNSTWGVELVKRVGSDHFRLLYDIYHMQIMEGDVIRTIERDHEYFGHYHTAGNPGRHELDENQELNYPPIAKAIADVGFKGYFAHEFIPKGDTLAGLTSAVAQCVV